jgi:hypothetical protein
LTRLHRREDGRIKKAEAVTGSAMRQGTRSRVMMRFDDFDMESQYPGAPAFEDDSILT